MYKILLACFMLCSCSASRMIETDLYFGQSKPDNTPITQAEWENFRKEQIARVFKEGFTVVSASGSWYDTDQHQLISEPTYIVVYFHKKSPQLSQQIDSLRSWYQIRFQQQSVLRVDKKVKADF